jgi:hypothetical protein
VSRVRFKAFGIANLAIVAALSGCATLGPNAGPVTSGSPSASALLAGVASIPLNLPAATPLAGYGGPGRRLAVPDLNPANGYTFFKPATGAFDALKARALVLANNDAKVGFLTVDAVGILGDLVDRIHEKAVLMGSTVKRGELVVSASHTHSGPGSLTGLHFWELAGADLLHAPLRDAFVARCAEALVTAEINLQPAKLGLASGALAGVTTNRRAGVSPNITPAMVDEELGVIRVDKADGSPLAVLWNFAIHGTAYDETNLKYSADVMGAASGLVEAELGAPVLFANGAEGDAAPVSTGAAGIAVMAPLIAQKVVAVHTSVTPQAAVTLRTASEVVPFGKATLDLNLSRLPAGTTGLNLPVFLTSLPIAGLSLPVKMGPDWFENNYRFQAIRINDALIVPVPGEPIFFVGRTMKTESLALGFSKVFVFGLSNGHMAYITDQAEYNVGGYEGIATFFGPSTGDKVWAAARTQVVKVQ